MKTHRSLLAALAALVLLAAARAQTPLETGTAALKSGDFTAAEAALAPLVAGDKPDVAALLVLSQVRVAQRNSKDAIALAEKAVQLAPDNAAAHAQLGLALSSRMPELAFMQQAVFAGKMKKAFEKALELDPKNLNALIGLARYYTNAPEIAGGSLPKAAEFAARVRALDVLLGELELARIAERGEKFDEALQHYQAASELKPDNANLQFATGRVLAKLGRKDEARARLTSALQLKPDLDAAKKLLAELDAAAATR